VASLWLGLGYASHHPDGAAAEEYEPTGATAAPAPHYTAVSPYSMAYGLRDSVSHKPLFSAGSSEIWEAQTGTSRPPPPPRNLRTCACSKTNPHLV
jgi:hypothetical protein